MRRLPFRGGLARAAVTFVAAATVASVASLGAVPARAMAAGSLAASGCPLFPSQSVWHADVSRLPVHARSGTWMASMGRAAPLHADFGSGTWNGGLIGMPFTVVPASQPKVPVHFTYAGESDPGPYPIPADAPIEGGAQASGDRHVLVVQAGTCRLYELFDAHPDGQGWQAGSGAVYDLRANRLRPAGWTSADAAGLPILAGLVRYEEVAAGHVDHAIRVTVNRSQASYLWPARHQAGDADTSLPPMGLRLRLKAGVDISGFSSQPRAILRAMRTYGLIVADNGTSGMIGGVPDPRWDNDALHQLGRLTLADFEAVDESGLQVDPDSTAYRGAAAPLPATPVRPVKPAAAAAHPAPHIVLAPHRPVSAEPAAVAAPGLNLAATLASLAKPDGAKAGRSDTILGVPRAVLLVTLGLLCLALVALATRARVAAAGARRRGRHARPRRAGGGGLRGAGGR
jgi:hypothetical protein